MTQSTIHKIMSGQRVGWLFSVSRAALWLASLPYGLLMAVRNFAYDVGIKRVHRVEVPVVAVGNLTTGGTGKTPIVAMLVQQLQELGHRPGIVSRGYHADETGENDEKRVLKLMCPDVPHVQNANRVVAAEELIRDHKVTVIVLDDAYQHRRIHRDLNICLIDATNPFGFGYLLPRGLLREWKSGIRRADFVLVTRADAGPRDIGEINAAVSKLHPLLADAIHRVSFKPTELMTAAGEKKSLDDVRGQRVAVMTAIGNPQAFVDTCAEKLGADVVSTTFFPDHHHFTAEELDNVQSAAEESATTMVLTTLKDLVKIPPERQNFHAVLIETVFEDGNGEAFVKEKLEAAGSQPTDTV